MGMENTALRKETAVDGRINEGKAPGTELGLSKTWALENKHIRRAYSGEGMVTYIYVFVYLYIYMHKSKTGNQNHVMPQRSRPKNHTETNVG